MPPAVKIVVLPYQRVDEIEEVAEHDPEHQAGCCQVAVFEVPGKRGDTEDHGEKSQNRHCHGHGHVEMLKAIRS